MKTLCVSSSFSTTRLVIVTHQPDAKPLAAPSGGRKCEGGLRTKGFVKRSFTTYGGQWHMCDSEGQAIEKIELAITTDSNYLPVITIITVVFNGVAHIEQTIQSVLNQSYPNVEYIIIDGGSTDGTLDIIRKYDGEVDYWVSEKDGGIFHAMNKGIVMATGASIGLLNCGDQYRAEFISTLCQGVALEKIPHVVLYSDYSIRFEDIKIETPSKSTFQPWKGMSICHQAMLIGRGIYKQIGLYDIQYSFAADYEYFLRIVNAEGGDFIYRPFQGVSFLHGGVSTERYRDSLREASRINFEYFRYLPLRRIGFLLINETNYFVCVFLKKWSVRLLGQRTLQKIRVLKKTIGLRLKK